jgi:hypothetical protein
MGAKGRRWETEPENNVREKERVKLGAARAKEKAEPTKREELTVPASLELPPPCVARRSIQQIAQRDLSIDLQDSNAALNTRTA